MSMDWNEVLKLATIRSQKYAKLIGDGVNPDDALNQVYGRIQADQIRQDLQEIEDKMQPLQHHTPLYGC